MAFDPERARSLVRQQTPEWDAFVRQLPSGDNPEGGDRIPTLLFPFWVDDEPGWLIDAGTYDGRSFDTVVRLPHDERFEEDTGLTAEDFRDKVLEGFEGVSDQIVVLLDAFGTIVIEDDLAEPTVIKRVVEREIELSDGVTRSDVRIDRNGIEIQSVGPFPEPSSGLRWPRGCHCGSDAYSRGRGTISGRRSAGARR